MQSSRGLPCRPNHAPSTTFPFSPRRDPAPTPCQRYPSPNAQHTLLVLCLPRPYGNLVPLGSDVDDGPTHLPAVLLKALPDQTQQLEPKKRRRMSLPGGHRVCPHHPETTATHQPSPFPWEASPPSPSLTVSSHRWSSSLWRCCLARLTSQRPPRLFLLSSHMGSMPSWEAGLQINHLPLFRGK